MLFRRSEPLFPDSQVCTSSQCLRDSCGIGSIRPHQSTEFDDSNRSLIPFVLYRSAPATTRPHQGFTSGDKDKVSDFPEGSKVQHRRFPAGVFYVRVAIRAL